MSNDSYTVPILSLSNSRSRKNIPTKDAYQPRNYSIDNKSPIISSNPYLERREEQKITYTIENRTSTNYFNLPPRPQMNQLPPSIPRKQVKQISRNVYLSSEDDNYHTLKSFNNGENRNQNQLGTTSNVSVEKPRQALSNSGSRGSLFRNPESRVQIQSQVMRQTNNMEFKKLDINKALFDRKMTKIMQEIEFYDEELNGLYNDSLEDQLEELETIKDQSKRVHSKILQDLNRLIA